MSGDDGNRLSLVGGRHPKSLGILTVRIPIALDPFVLAPRLDDGPVALYCNSRTVDCAPRPRNGLRRYRPQQMSKIATGCGRPSDAGFLRVRSNRMLRVRQLGTYL